MYGRTLIRSFLLTGAMLWVWGCIPATWHHEDPYFSGYHYSDSSPGVTTAIIDRETIRREQPPRAATRPAPRPQEIPAEETYSDYTYQDWQRDQQRNEADIQINLSYHLGGPYYYHDFRDRYWRGYMRRWHRLPWYANGWWFDDLWWDHHFWNPYQYQQYGWYDPWYGYYDPWYSYYDPWYGYYYDPFWSYSRHGYYRHHYYADYGWGPHWGHYSGGYRSDPDERKTTTARTRNRADLPTSVPSGSGMTTSARSSSAASSSSGSSSKSSARTTVRKGSSATSSSSDRSSSSGSRATKSSSSKSSSKSSSSKTSRSRNRKP